MNNNEILFKVLVSSQIMLEGLDELKANNAFYKGKLKVAAKQFVNAYSHELRPMMDNLWWEDEETSKKVLEAYESILDSLVKGSASDLMMKATLLNAFDSGEIKYENG